MAGRPPSWKDVARVLSLRLYNHAFCSEHPENAPEPDCPSCEDRTAYRLWQRKAGIDPTPKEMPGALVDIFEWNRANRIAEGGNG